MRISGGVLKGADLHGVAPSTHPMGERQRLSIFNALGDIKGLTCLDAFAGSGLIGFEALSRGAAHVYAVERDPKAFAHMSRHAATLLPPELAKKWHPHNCGIRVFGTYGMTADILIADPPYDNVRLDLLELLPHMCQNVLVLSLPKQHHNPDFSALGFRFIKEGVHAGAKLLFYKNEK